MKLNFCLLSILIILLGCNSKQHGEVKIESKSFDWLYKLYPDSFSQYNNSYYGKQKILEFEKVNDSVSFVILERLTGVCYEKNLHIIKNKVEVDFVPLFRDCDHDGSMPVRFTTDYIKNGINLFLITETTYSVPDSLVEEGIIVGKKSFHEFEEKELIVDSNQTLCKVSPIGVIDSLPPP